MDGDGAHLHDRCDVHRGRVVAFLSLDGRQAISKTLVAGSRLVAHHEQFWTTALTWETGDGNSVSSLKR